ncbi:glycyl-tRNA synthetase subunit beta [Sphingobium indicum IP26]|uniref:Glycine--tRNA ligase beta subunit n=1 Tax=Sphingobium indicum F2 TaxID=1450518 RepID=A0A8E0WVR4_9SPHN|nr:MULTISPECIES: glycine--tRNA ligase subunit beta [Sphingobium]EPR09662.1 glycyl-tRNA synthetase subunit beta [Sphingobium indicum IP26]EQB05296.1 glycyl-tRNA synthetase subunit beta [Sphingobium sp. HDIP04]KER36243.1 glycyl-tRNA synthetase subunit beta [Sphingobium indicum F2]KER38307.1 glycyl-tRNA synthetase subunit beta [Sphingobium indicum F2]
MTDFLLELRCEEIPARMQLKASEDLARLFTEELAKSGLKPASIDSFVTPRRLALIARNLPLETAAVSEEHKGPRTSAPAQALEGFLRKTGLTQDQLEDRDGVWFAVINKPGRATAQVLAEAIPTVIRAFPWPKSMRWGKASQTTESLRWVRPLQGIVAILGEELVDIEIEGIKSGYATLGHRFHHPGEITIGGAHDYAEKLRACHVIASHQERQSIIEAKAAEAAAAHGYTVIEDKGLVAENAGLTEWPVPLLGDFDPAFLEVPPEVIQLTLRINQKYFVLRDTSGKLAPAFICTANIEAKDGGAAIVAGNRKVLAARLSDARFFWEQDRKTKLEDHAKKLERITFHEKLGTVTRKVNRVATIAADRIPELIGWSQEKARKMQPLLKQAAELAKADLVTEMVGEFPELQGVMGGYYAEAEGLSVSAAIRDHYKPAGQSDDLPSDEIGTVVSLADKVDTLYSFFLIDQKPTGSKDPYALRRAALGLIRLLVDNNLRVSLSALYKACDWERLYQSDGVNYADPTDDLVSFTVDRLKVQQKEAGVRHDLIDAVFALGGEDDLVRLLARVKALQSFIATDDGTNLLAGYKRAANILKKEGVETAEKVEISYAPEQAEADLIAALDAAEPRAAAAVAAEDFEGAMAALATLRAPIDAFFETVTVNDADQDKRAARLALLSRVRDAVHTVADFSKITG